MRKDYAPNMNDPEAKEDTSEMTKKDSHVLEVISFVVVVAIIVGLYLTNNI